MASFLPALRINLGSSSNSFDSECTGGARIQRNRIGPYFNFKAGAYYNVMLFYRLILSSKWNSLFYRSSKGPAYSMSMQRHFRFRPSLFSYPLDTLIPTPAPSCQDKRDLIPQSRETASEKNGRECGDPFWMRGFRNPSGMVMTERPHDLPFKILFHREAQYGFLARWSSWTSSLCDNTMSIIVAFHCRLFYQ